MATGTCAATGRQRRGGDRAWQKCGNASAVDAAPSALASTHCPYATAARSHPPSSTPASHARQRTSRLHPSLGHVLATPSADAARSTRSSRDASLASLRGRKDERTKARKDERTKGPKPRPAQPRLRVPFLPLGERVALTRNQVASCPMRLGSRGRALIGAFPRACVRVLAMRGGRGGVMFARWSGMGMDRDHQRVTSWATAEETRACTGARGVVLARPRRRRAGDCMSVAADATTESH